MTRVRAVLSSLPASPACRDTSATRAAAPLRHLAAAPRSGPGDLGGGGGGEAGRLPGRFPCISSPPPATDGSPTAAPGTRVEGPAGASGAETALRGCPGTKPGGRHGGETPRGGNETGPAAFRSPGESRRVPGAGGAVAGAGSRQGARGWAQKSKRPDGTRLLRVGTSISLFTGPDKRRAGAIFPKEFCISPPPSPASINRPFPRSL